MTDLMRTSKHARSQSAQRLIYQGALHQLGIALPATPKLRVQPPKFPGQRDVADAALAVLEAGKDPAADKNVQQLVTGWQLSQVGITEAIAERAAIAQSEEAERHALSIIPDIAARFADDIAIVQAALPLAGNLDLASGFTLRPGTPRETAIELSAASAALYDAQAIVDNWGHVLAVIGVPAQTKAHVPLRWSKPTLDQWHARDHRGERLSLLEQIRLGVTLELATSCAEIQNRIAALEAEQDRRDREADELSSERLKHAWKR